MNMGENVPLDEKRKQEKTGLMEGGRIGGGDRRGVRGIWEYGRGTPGCIEISGIF